MTEKNTSDEILISKEQILSMVKLDLKQKLKDASKDFNTNIELKSLTWTNDGIVVTVDS